MSETVLRMRAKQVRAALWLAISLPAILFYSVLAWLNVDLPVGDDYDAGLDFINRLTHVSGFWKRLVYLVGSQHNEYKVFVAQGVVWAQYSALGHLNFKVLGVLGNLTVLLLAYFLWRMFLPNEENRVRRLALFFPVSLLLFELQYAETLNWPTPGLQNVPVVVFAVGCLWALGLGSRRGYVGALALLVLAIASSGNGFILVPVGLAMMLVQRHWGRMVGWLAAFAVCVAAYAYHYNPMATQNPEHHSLLVALTHPRVPYIVAFLGAGLAEPFSWMAIPLGAALLLFFGWLVWRGYWRTHLAVTGCVVFVLLTAVGVAGLRSDFGLAQSLSSRYRIYSDLLLILAWFGVAEMWLRRAPGRLMRNWSFIGAVVVIGIYSLKMDTVGIHILLGRDRELREGMREFEHPAPDKMGPVIVRPGQAAAMDTFDAHAREVLLESERLGVYQPPVYNPN